MPEPTTRGYRVSGNSRCRGISLAVWLIAVALAAPVHAQDEEAFGLRGTLLDVGLFAPEFSKSYQVQAMQAAAAEAVVVPKIEAMIPAGPGDMLVGMLFTFGAKSTEGATSWPTSEWAATVGGLSVGYAIPVLRGERASLRLGGRAGLALAWMDGTPYYNFNEGRDGYSDGTMFSGSVFVSGEYLLFSGLGLQAEAGAGAVSAPHADINIYGGYPEEDLERYWGGYGYAALSGVVRFGCSGPSQTGDGRHSSSRFGVRGTVWGDSLMALGFPEAATYRSLVALDTSRLAVPVLEVLVPAWGGELLFGFLAADLQPLMMGHGEDGAADEQYEFMLLGGSVGYAFPFLTDGANAVRMGGRLGGGWGDLYDTARGHRLPAYGQGACLSASAFLSAEYSLDSFLAVQFELGLNGLASFHSEEVTRCQGSECQVDPTSQQNVWAYPYSAVSAVLRF